MKRTTKHSYICVTLIVLLLSGCSALQTKQTIDQFTKDYEENSQAVRELAKITAKDWPLGAGMIMGALSEEQLPGWVYKELVEVSSWFIDGMGGYNTEVELNDFKLGYITGLRFRMFGPVVRSFLELYVPNLLQVSEVAAFLIFFGI